jgi:hypothetical protein
MTHVKTGGVPDGVERLAPKGGARLSRELMIKSSLPSASAEPSRACNPSVDERNLGFKGGSPRASL